MEGIKEGGREGRKERKDGGGGKGGGGFLTLGGGWKNLQIFPASSKFALIIASPSLLLRPKFRDILMCLLSVISHFQSIRGPETPTVKTLPEPKFISPLLISSLLQATTIFSGLEAFCGLVIGQSLLPLLHSSLRQQPMQIVSCHSSAHKLAMTPHFHQS